MTDGPSNVIDFREALQRFQIVKRPQRPHAPAWDACHLDWHSERGGPWHVPHVTALSVAPPWHDSALIAVCQACEDTSGLRPGEDGRWGPCEACEPIRALSRRLMRAGIPWEWSGVEGRTDVKRLPNREGSPPGRLWWGPPGCGKSHAAALMAWQALRVGCGPHGPRRSALRRSASRDRRSSGTALSWRSSSLKASRPCRGRGRIRPGCPGTFLSPGIM